MKKRILAILLTVWFVVNISACNYVSNDNIKETTKESSTESINSTKDTQNTIEMDEKSCQSENNKKITLGEYQELVGCRVTTESSENLKHLMTKDETKIKVEQEANGSNLFYITIFQDGIEYKTGIALSERIKTPDIYSGFTSQQNGYVIIFDMEGYSVSPMDDIELACILRTADGGKTWAKIEYNNFKVSNGREYISAACFFTEEVGFFTARYTDTDHFGPRTYWTVDGGKTWTCMAKLDMPHFLQPFGFPNDFSSEISDVELLNGVYTLTVRVCHGYSIEFAEETDCDIYIQYSSMDLLNWTLVS